MKFHGKVGFMTEAQETSPGVWSDGILEKSYRGEYLPNQTRRNYDIQDSTNTEIKFNNRISIVADPFIMSYLGSVIYVESKGIKWKVTSVEDAYPRILISFGGVYNGRQT